MRERREGKGKEVELELELKREEREGSLRRIPRDWKLMLSRSPYLGNVWED